MTLAPSRFFQKPSKCVINAGHQDPPLGLATAARRGRTRPKGHDTVCIITPHHPRRVPVVFRTTPRPHPCLAKWLKWRQTPRDPPWPLRLHGDRMYIWELSNGYLEHVKYPFENIECLLPHIKFYGCLLQCSSYPHEFRASSVRVPHEFRRVPHENRVEPHEFRPSRGGWLFAAQSLDRRNCRK